AEPAQNSPTTACALPGVSPPATRAPPSPVSHLGEFRRRPLPPPNDPATSPGSDPPTAAPRTDPNAPPKPLHRRFSVLKSQLASWVDAQEPGIRTGGRRSAPDQGLLRTFHDGGDVVQHPGGQLAVDEP